MKQIIIILLLAGMAGAQTPGAWEKPNTIKTYINGIGYLTWTAPDSIKDNNIKIYPQPVAGAQDNAIGTSDLTFSPSEVHLTPRPDTTTIYIYYTGGEVDTIKVLPTKAKSDSFLLKFREAVICSVARQQIK